MKMSQLEKMIKLAVREEIIETLGPVLKTAMKEAVGQILENNSYVQKEKVNENNVSQILRSKGVTLKPEINEFQAEEKPKNKQQKSIQNALLEMAKNIDPSELSQFGYK